MSNTNVNAFLIVLFSVGNGVIMETFVPKGNIRGPIIPSFIFDLELSPGAIVAYTVLCNYAGDKDHCWPSYKTMCSKLHKCKGTVISYINELVKANLIQVVSGKYKTNIYYILNPKSSMTQETNTKNNNYSYAGVVESSFVTLGTKNDHGRSNFVHSSPEIEPINNLKNNNINNTPPIPPVGLQARQDPLPTDASPAAECASDSDFQSIWIAYPRKESRRKALKQWNALARTGQLPPLTDLLETIAFRSQSEPWQKEKGRFVPRLAKWLAERRWEDELTAEEKENFDAWLEQKRRDIRAKEIAKAKADAIAAARQRLRPLFDNLARCFGQNSYGEEIFSYWCELHEKNYAPYATDVPPGNSLGLLDFIKDYRRMKIREDAAQNGGYFTRKYLLNTVIKGEERR